MLRPAQREKFLNDGNQAFVVSRIHVEQFRIADDLIQARLALERADLFEHALIVASTLHAVNHQLLAADDRRFICTAAFTMANSSGAATIVKPISIIRSMTWVAAIAWAAF